MLHCPPHLIIGLLRTLYPFGLVFWPKDAQKPNPDIACAVGSASLAHRVVGIGESEKRIAAPGPRRRAVHQREHLRFETGKTADRRCGCTRKRSGMKHLLRNERGPNNIIVSKRRSVAGVGK
jgi:hypothetical protein